MEQETGRILRTLTDRTIGERDAIALRDILTSRIPGGIKTFLQADIMDELEREFALGRRFARVNLSAPGMSGVMKGFIRTCALEYVFPRAEFIASLNHATHFLGNYVCRPQWTLREFLFEDVKSLPQKMFVGRLQYTSDYPYFKTLLHAMVIRKEWKEITAGQFGHLAARVDRLMMQQLGARELAELTQPIFDFFALSGLRPDGRIPLKPLLVFFNDKNQHVLTRHLERVCTEEARGELSLEDLITIFERLEESAQSNAETLLQYSTTTEEQDNVIDQALSEAAGSETNDTMIPAADDTSLEESTGDNEVEENSTPSSRQSRRNGNLNPALALTYAGIAEQPNPSLPSIASLISPELRGVLIRRIFGKDEAYYTGVVDALDRTRTWKDASLYLNTFYEDNSLDPFADEVVQFTDIVQHRYATSPGVDT